MHGFYSSKNVTGVRSNSRFGQLEWNGSQIITFKVKPQTRTERINDGFLVLNKRIFDYVSEDENCVFEGEPLENLAANQQIMMFQHDGLWQCTDISCDKSHLDTIYLAKDYYVYKNIGGLNSLFLDFFNYRLVQEICTN